jgi:hypothetical protein
MFNEFAFDLCLAIALRSTPAIFTSKIDDEYILDRTGNFRLPPCSRQVANGRFFHAITHLLQSVMGSCRIYRRIPRMNSTISIIMMVYTIENLLSFAQEEPACRVASPIFNEARI